MVDPQGASAPGATVTATNSQTGFVRTETTDNTGSYRVAALPVATYEVTVELSGFRDAVAKAVVVNVAQTQALDFQLRVAGIAQQVTVSGNAPLDRSDVIVGRSRRRSVTRRGIAAERPPVRRTSPPRIPGVGIGFHVDPTKGVNYAPLVNGGAGRNINYQIDGGDNNDDTVGGLLQQFPLEAIQEFHFETQRFKAEYGRSNGGVMNVVTKSGTNQLPGNASSRCFATTR